MPQEQPQEPEDVQGAGEYKDEPAGQKTGMAQAIQTTGQNEEPPESPGRETTGDQGKVTTDTRGGGVGGVSERSVVRSELNLEQNSIFTVSTYREKSREVCHRETTTDGSVIQRKAIVGRTADGIETGVLTTYHFKVYLALIDLWEKAGRPIQEPIHFTTLRIMKRLGMNDSGEEYRHFRRWLRNLRQIPITFINSFYTPGATEHTDLADVTVLNHLHIYERKNVGKEKKTRGYGEFRFDDHILENLMHNYTHPLRLDVIKSFTRHRDMCILLYTYIDRNLAFKCRYEVGLGKLFDHLDLSQRHVKYPSDRKRVVEPVLGELRGRPLSTGILSSCYILRTEDGRNYKLVCCKKPRRRLLGNGNSLSLIDMPQTGTETETGVESGDAHEPDSPLLELLMREGLTRKQSVNLLSERSESAVKAQLEFLPFRLEEYAARGREVKAEAILYDSIMENWRPPAGYFQAEHEKEEKAKRKELMAEYAERVQGAKAEAEAWAARPAEERIAAKLGFWLDHERFMGRQPMDGEVEEKKRELVSELPSREEYQQLLMDVIQRDMRGRGQAA